VTTRALDRLDQQLTPWGDPDADASVASQRGGRPGGTLGVGQLLLAPVALPPITDPTVVLQITALLGPLAEWGVELSLVAPTDGPLVAHRDLMGMASHRPWALPMARRKAG
jgi:hypothetical protein